MTLLTICDNAVNNLGVGSTPISIIGNPDPAAVRLLQMARRTATSLAKRANWVSQIIEHTFTANGGSDYPLPPDYRSIVDNTMWDRSRYWRMRGVISPQQWQRYKSSNLGQATIERRWRIRVPTGAAAGVPAVFSVDPPLSSTDKSSSFVFEYVSKYWCQSAALYEVGELVPVVGGSGYVVGDQFAIGGGTYTTQAVGTVTSLSGSAIATAEIVTPGSYSVRPSSPAASTATTGVGVGATFLVNTATVPGAAQPDWVADTDTGLVDEDLIELGVVWRLARRLGFAYDEEKDEYEREVDKAVARDGGTAILNLVPINYLNLIGPGNIYDGYWPTGLVP